jgi:coenzyme F420 hydrogenase subunit beta
MQPGGPTELRERVLAADLCTGCGACVGHCPYLKTLGERVAFVYPCPLTEGRCFNVCPRTGLEPESLDHQVFGSPRTDPLLGSYQGLYFARALEPQVTARGQYGGVTTALTVFALESGVASGALLTGGSPMKLPHPVVAWDREAVLAAAGTKYSACPTLASLDPLLRETDETLAVVGRPCQVTALRKIEASGRYPERLSLIIGIFCFWALSPAIYRFVASRTDLPEATKVDIPKEAEMIFSVNGNLASIPLEEIRPFIRPACQSCFDPTSEWADVSVGSTEYDPAWNTLMVRTARGRSIVEAAVEANMLEMKPYPPERLPILWEAVQGKKHRVLEVLEAQGPETAYLQLTEADRIRLRA